MEIQASGPRPQPARAPRAQTQAADIGEDRLVRAFRRLLNNSKDKAEGVMPSGAVIECTSASLDFHGVEFP